jgi:hypothetical protein
MWRLAAFSLQRGLDLVADGANLSGVRAARDHEHLGDADDVPDVEDDRVLGLLVVGGSCGGDRPSVGVQVVSFQS